MMCLLCLLLLKCGMGVPSSDGPTINLQEARISVSYRLVFDRPLKKSKVWLMSNHHPTLDKLAKDIFRLNEVLAEVLRWLYEKRGGVASGRHCLLAVMHEHKHIRSAFGHAWDSIKSLEALEPVKLRTPVPPLVMHAIPETPKTVNFTQ